MEATDQIVDGKEQEDGGKKILSNDHLPPMEYITDEHRNYEPTDVDLFITVKSGDYQRLIWGAP